MLKSLNISDFAVIRQLHMEFGVGLNLLTGETGSGKSIIVDALGLLLGNRASPEQIRTGEELALVEGLFELPEEKVKALSEHLAEVGVQLEDDEELLVRREINLRGRSRIFINDQQVTLRTLRTLQPSLVEIHGQGEQRSLLSTQSHMDLLDSFAGCLDQRALVLEAFFAWQSSKRALLQLEQELINRERDTELLQFQLTEIEFVGPRAGEEEELQGERKLLAHAERVLQLGAGAYAELYEDDNSLLARLSVIRRQLEELAEIDDRMASVLSMLESGFVALTDVADALRTYRAGIEVSPGRLAEVETRLAVLEKLKHKYKTDLQGVIKIQDELSQRLSGLTNLSARERSLRESLQGAQAQYSVAARLLTERRKEAAPLLERRIMADLAHVALGEARFIVQIETAAEEQGVLDSNAMDEQANDLPFFTPRGADRVEFLLSANPGETPRPLARIASGGELSRLMLTLRTAGTTNAQPPVFGESYGTTVVFDEIDVGIGGRVAEAVGRRLKMLAQERQVLCVTHQAQIARFADQHFVVEKSVQNGRTMTLAKKLDAEERVGELSRMIGGAEDLETTRETARWLLDNAYVTNARVGRRRGQTKS